MHLDYTDEQRALRDELREYMRALMSPELVAELRAREAGGPSYHRAVQQLGRDGWLGIGWPKEHGGQGRGPIEQFIFFDEVQRTGFPVPILTLNTVGPTLARFGTEAQKREFLPRILEGRCHFSIGYTEPGAGTDLAALTTTAVRDGDEYVISGQKMWTSLADHADYMWLACRTDAAAPPHRGISILIVPADAPGVSVVPIRALGDNTVFAVYYDSVRVPVSNLVGPENGGWKLITTQLNHERVALCAVGPMEQIADDTVEWARSVDTGNGTMLIDIPWVQASLARVYAQLDVLKLMNWKQAWAISNDTLQAADASAIKVFGSELYVRASSMLMEIHGALGCLRRGSELAALQGSLERFYRMSLILTFGGGTNEIQRDIICQVGLGMPRSAN